MARDEAPKLGLVTDLYELTMATSYRALGMRGRATFSLFVRKLPRDRAYLVAGGIADAVDRLQRLGLDETDAEYLASTGRVPRATIDELARTRFTGDVWAVHEGELVFADEPILEVEAPIIEAQLVETLLLNAIHYATAVTTKAARCVAAASGRPVVDFGLRRTPGIEGGAVAARASFLAGFSATSNVFAGARFAIPISGTVAHSFIEALPNEREAFRAWVRTSDGPVTLLVDTYDTLRGLTHGIEIMREYPGRVVAVRLDSGDLDALSRAARGMLDAAGFGSVRIIASGGLDEYSVDKLVRAGAPIDGFGVGTRVGMSADAPVLDMAYKLVAYEGRPCLKLSEGKQTLAFAKQVFRRRVGARYIEDRIAARDEPPPGPEWRRLLEPVIVGGVPRSLATLEQLRTRHRCELAAFAPELLQVHPEVAYRVSRSEVLEHRQRAAVEEIRGRESVSG